ncbi:MAG: aminoacetone oxidase family FAD-binding enzyme, partial [Eubacterium sp.]|nr:aminoacetone oxidase family FAD-binding enzyme [Eubacterium sp.]
MSKKVLIIGGGAAGLMAAAQSAKRGNDTLVVEKMSRPARKMMITGKGRCNVTNATFELDGLVENVPKNARFLYSAFSAFMPYDTIALLEEQGVKTKIERGNRVFPESDKAVDVVDAFVNYAKNCGAKFVQGTVKDFEIENGKIVSAVLENGEKLAADAFAVCTGGASYPLTGSTGDGYTLAKRAGHTVTPLSPSLIPLVLSNNFVPALQGLSLKNVSITVYESENEVYSDFGEMLFTHYGISGPIVLSASAHIKEPEKKNYTVKLDLKPALDEQTLDKRLQRDFALNNNKNFINSLSKLLPNKLIPVIVRLSKIEPSLKCNQITREQRLSLVKLLKGITLYVTGFRPL